MYTKTIGISPDTEVKSPTTTTTTTTTAAMVTKSNGPIFHLKDEEIQKLFPITRSTLYLKEHTQNIFRVLKYQELVSKLNNIKAISKEDLQSIEFISSFKKMGMDEETYLKILADIEKLSPISLGFKKYLDTQFEVIECHWPFTTNGIRGQLTSDEDVLKLMKLLHGSDHSNGPTAGADISIEHGFYLFRCREMLKDYITGVCERCKQNKPSIIIKTKSKLPPPPQPKPSAKKSFGSQILTTTTTTPATEKYTNKIPKTQTQEIDKIKKPSNINSNNHQHHQYHNGSASNIKDCTKNLVSPISNNNINGSSSNNSRTIDYLTRDEAMKMFKELKDTIDSLKEYIITNVKNNNTFCINNNNKRNHYKKEIYLKEVEEEEEEEEDEDVRLDDDDSYNDSDMELNIHREEDEQLEEYVNDERVLSMR